MLKMLVLPDEAVVADGAAHVVRDLPRLLERTADQQHAELVAAEARHGVAVADRIAQQLRHFAQHAVAGEMSARVVHDLEAIEVEIAQHVLAIAAMSALDRLFEAPLEFAAVDEAGERIVRRLIRHLPREAAQLRHVVQQDDRARHFLVGVANRRRGQLDRTLAAIRLREQQRAAAEIHRRAAWSSACFTGSLSRRRSVSSTRPMISSSVLPMALPRFGAGELLRRGVRDS